MGRGRTPPYPANIEWTTSRFWSFIRGSLRSKFRSWPPKYKCKALARTEIQDGLYKSGRFKGQPKMVGRFACAICNGAFMDKDVEVDHLVAAGSLKGAEDLAGFVTRMFCHEDHLQVVCKPCHKLKTAAERKKK